MTSNGLIFSPKLNTGYGYNLKKPVENRLNQEKRLADKKKGVKITDNAAPEKDNAEESKVESAAGKKTDVPSGDAAADSQEPSCKQEKRDIKGAEKIIEDLKLELAAEKDRVLRLSAEFENYKKRSAREAEDFRKFANESLFKQLLSVVDNLERAISSASESEATKSILEGVKLTHKEMIKFMTSFNVKALEAEGKPFDPAYHQAVTQQESDEHPDNTVMMELQKGYLLHDRLIRPSMVVVSTAKKEKEQANQES